MFSLLRKSNWKKVDHKIYSDAYATYGGSFVTHPKVLQILADITGIEPTYYARYRHDELSGAVATWKNFLAGDKKAIRHFKTDRFLDLGYPEILLPISPREKFHIPFRARFLSHVHDHQIKNIKPNRDRSLMLLKPYDETGISGKHHNTLKRKLKKFLEQDGSYKPIAEHHPNEIAEIYTRLFFARFNKNPPACENLLKVMTKLHPFLYGYVLYVEKNPIAIQINYQAQSSQYLTIDYVNGGVDPRFQQLSVGSVLHYLNTYHAYQQAKQANLILRYSFGIPTYAYKTRWCYQIPVHKL